MSFRGCSYAMLAWSVGCAGCGGIAIGAGDDGGGRDSRFVSDATNDHIVDAISEVTDDTADDGYDGGGDGPSARDAITDSLVDASLDCASKLVGEMFFDACTPASCAPGEYCAYSEGRFQANYGFCATVPACCSGRCGCIIDHVPFYCLDASCSDNAGSIVLTCQRALPP
jgi:hypothetical protein